MIAMPVPRMVATRTSRAVAPVQGEQAAPPRITPSSHGMVGTLLIGIRLFVASGGAPSGPGTPGVRAEIVHIDPGVPSGGLVTARLYHLKGTPDASPSGKREFWFSIDEMTSAITSPTL